MSRSKGRGRRPQHLGNVTSDGSRTIIRGDVIDLGDIGGEQRPPVQASFTYFGQRVRVNPLLSEIDVMDFFDEAEKVNAKDPRAMVILKDYARNHIHPDDFDRFWETMKANAQDSNALMALLWKILEGITGNPTGSPSGSSDGQTATSPASPDGSSPQGGDQSRRAAFLRQIDRYEAMGTGQGAAMAAQIATIAESQGIDLGEAPVRADVRLGVLTG